MPGSPMKRATLVELEKRARAMFGPPGEGEPEPTALDYVCARIEDGGNLLQIAGELGVSRSVVARALRGRFEDAADRMAEARRASGEVHAERGMQITDESAEDRDAVFKAEKQAKYRQWLASKLDRAVFGEDKAAVAVQVNLGDLHLDALRVVKAEASRRGEVARARGPSALASGQDSALSDSESAAWSVATDDVATDYELLDAGSLGGGSGIPPAPAPAGAADAPI